MTAGEPLKGGSFECWAMDFMSDALFDRRPFRIWPVAECHGRDGLVSVARVNFRVFKVIKVLDRLVRKRGSPGTSQCNDLEFAGQLVDQWTYLNAVEVDLSRLGRPTDNAFV